MIKRKYILLEGYDGTSVRIPIQKGSSWFTKRHGNRCVVSCRNQQEIIHISEKGLANIAYCEAHAEIRIIHDLLWGLNSRGLWVQCRKGKLVAYSEYGWIVNHLLKITKDKTVRRRLRQAEKKIKDFNKRNKAKQERNSK